MIGTRVEYRGSVEDARGCRFVVANEAGVGGDARCDLATYRGEVALRGVRASSMTPVPAGERHRVLCAEIRAQIVQGEFARQYPVGSWKHYVHEAMDTLPRRVADLIAAKRPVEAEAALLNGEVFVGMISPDVFESRMRALVVAGDDESWLL